MVARLPFPDDFVWGAATSSYQIEGGIHQDERGPSIWDVFCDQPGRVRNGDNGAVAIDHRNRMHEDVALMAELGLKAYRFSVAWSRVQPMGRGDVSKSGLDFYSSLVDALLEANIEPYVTLYHWDLPAALSGGWLNRDTAHRFGEYAEIVADRLSDRVRNWTTLNEPWCSSMLGYAAGVHAPGVVDGGAAVVAAHHLLLAHGNGVQAIRAGAVQPVSVGITVNPYPVVAEGSSAEDLDAARRVDGVANRLWYDPVLKGAYPQDVLEDFAAVTNFEHIRDDDLTTIFQPIDSLGINYYRRHHACFSRGASSKPPMSQWPGSPDVGVVEPSGPHTSGGWAVEPDGLYETLKRLKDEYPPIALFVHENGAYFDDGPLVDGVVQDSERAEFLAAHIRAARRAIADGVDLRGYFAWSLFDNFEWAEGYNNRFGIVHVDFSTLDRTPKTSALLYRQIIADNAATPE
jgi:beta-glucosidase